MMAGGQCDPLRWVCTMMIGRNTASKITRCSGKPSCIDCWIDITRPWALLNRAGDGSDNRIIGLELILV